MISKAEYKKISKEWDGKIYQKYRKLKKRLPIIEKNIGFFKEAKVLELGSNAGMYAYLIYPVIKSYIGIEGNRSYYRQLVKTLHNCNAKIFNETFENIQLDKLNYDLFLASYVLHHLNINEIYKLETVFKRCNKVVIHTRSGDPLLYGHDEVGTDPLIKWKGSHIKYLLDSLNYNSTLQMADGYNGNYLILSERET